MESNAMKKFDISNLILSRIHDIYSYTLEEETEASAVTRHSLLIIKKKGRSVYTVAGTQYVADAEHIVYLPANTAYSLYLDHEGECTVMEFDTVENGTPETCCEFFTDGDEDLLTAVNNILYFWTLRGPAYHSKCLSEIYSLLTQISTLQAYAYTLAGKYGLIHKSVKFIERNYHRQDLYTATLAKMSGMGETYYRNIFQSVFGVPPTRYIQQYRVEKSKEKLVNDTGSVEEIAVSVGFANASYFCKVFKSLTGLTPLEFAEKARRVG
jgi:AraC-like DNA-binding protein